MLNRLRFSSGLVVALMPIALTLLAIYLAEFSPVDSHARAEFVFAAAIASFVWLVGVFSFAFCEYVRDQAQNERERTIFGMLSEAKQRQSLVQTAQPAGTPPPNTPTLRQWGFTEARMMRAFVQGWQNMDGQELLTAFWAEFPFKSYCELKDRFKLHLGWAVVEPSKFLPSTPEAILALADNIESEAAKIPADIPA